MKIAFLLLISLSLYSNYIFIDYKTSSANNIQKHKDLELTKSEYWSKHIKNIDTSFGYIESYKNILTCDKEKSTLTLYTKDSNNNYKLKIKYSALLGENSGDKIKEGDLKTPIGIYQITKKLSRKNRLDPFYGPLAFVTSYPNIYDKYRGKTGHGIWIHGIPAKQEREPFTKGCIVINNQDIESLNKVIDITDTLLITNSSKVSQNISKEVLSTILSQLYTWRYSWLFNDIDAYLNFYSDTFIRFDGMNIDRFKKYKTEIFKKAQKKTIIFDNINIVPYPNTKNIYQITFKEFYKSDTFKFTGAKTLIIRIDENNYMKILTEK